MGQRIEEFGSGNAEWGIFRLRIWDFGLLIGQSMGGRAGILEFGSGNAEGGKRSWEAERLKAES
jgi:hypothetical protein